LPFQYEVILVLLIGTIFSEVLATEICLDCRPLEVQNAPGEPRRAMSSDFGNVN
jgi:hypothetical protein